MAATHCHLLVPERVYWSASRPDRAGFVSYARLGSAKAEALAESSRPGAARDRGWAISRQSSSVRVSMMPTTASSQGTGETIRHRCVEEENKRWLSSGQKPG